MTADFTARLSALEQEWREASIHLREAEKQGNALQYMWACLEGVKARTFDQCADRLALLLGEIRREEAAKKVAAPLLGEGPRAPEEDAPAYTILVEREGEEFFASWTTGDRKEGGCARYSSTVVGALAELCATLLKVDEDKSQEAAALARPPQSPAPKSLALTDDDVADIIGAIASYMPFSDDRDRELYDKMRHVRSRLHVAEDALARLTAEKKEAGKDARLQEAVRAYLYTLQNAPKAADVRIALGRLATAACIWHASQTGEPT